VNDRLEPNDREQSARNSCSGNEAQDDQAQQSAGVAAALALEEEVGAGAIAGRIGSHFVVGVRILQREAGGGIGRPLESCSRVVEGKLFTARVKSWRCCLRDSCCARRPAGGGVDAQDAGNLSSDHQLPPNQLIHTNYCSYH